MTGGGVPPWRRLLLLAMFAVAGFLAWQFNERLYEDKGRLIVTDAGDRVVMAWASEVDLPMARRLHEAFQTWRGKTDHIVIDLNSPGGSLSEGRKVIEVIDMMKKTHRVDTRVGARAICLSMCVPLFLQGQTRTGAPDSRWMFHQPSMSDFFTGEDVEVPQGERQQIANRFFEQYFTNSDMNPVWRDRLEVAWRQGEVWRTGAALFAENANIINRLH